MSMEQRLLFVDDEKSILRALERLFFDSDYEILTAESGEEGLQILAENPVDVVISDMRMPGMDGYQFLNQVKTLYPSTTRLILSGYADEKIVLNSLIDGSSQFYLFKPWDGEALKTMITKLFESRHLYLNPRLLNVLNGLENLSVVTGIYPAVCRLIQQDAEISEIAKVIETDMAVTAAVLRVVNSSFYQVKTASLTQAITLLGLTAIKSIVLSCSLTNLVSDSVPSFSATRLSRHASIANLFMTRIYRDLLHKKLPDNLMTAGLLHNLGLIMCVHYFPDQYRKVAENYEASSDEILLTAIEKEMMGFSHAEIGGYLLDWWEIPYPTVECALFHHEPLHGAILNQEAVGAVHLANYYAWKVVNGQFARGLEEQVFSLLNIEQGECDHLLNV